MNVPSKIVILMLAAFAAASRSGAVESTSRDLHRETSELREFSTRPLVVYSARGRRDPFVATLVSSVGYDGQAIRISELSFVGVVSSGTRKVAMFRSATGREQTLMLKAGALYGPDNRPVPNISGKILGDRKVQLKQGNETLSFTASN